MTETTLGFMTNEGPPRKRGAPRLTNLAGDDLVVLTKTELDELIENASDLADLADLADEGATAAPRLASEAVAAIMEGSLHPLTAWRNAAGLTQGDLAAKAGLRPATISDFENGKLDPRLSTAGAIADALGVEIDDLIPPKA